jgi:hypothetical protein
LQLEGAVVHYVVGHSREDSRDRVAVFALRGPKSKLSVTTSDYSAVRIKHSPAPPEPLDRIGFDLFDIHEFQAKCVTSEHAGDPLGNTRFYHSTPLDIHFVAESEDCECRPGDNKNGERGSTETETCGQPEKKQCNERGT